ncbi:Fibrinogen C-terminal domain-containing protein [Balamuthia mandrillaris]
MRGQHRGMRSRSGGDMWARDSTVFGWGLSRAPRLPGHECRQLFAGSVHATLHDVLGHVMQHHGELRPPLFVLCFSLFVVVVTAQCKGCAEPEECSGGGVRCWDERCVDDITQCPPALKAVRMAPFSAVVHNGGPGGTILQLPLRDWNSKEEFGTVTLLTSDLPASVVVKVSRASFHLINQHEEVLDDNENRYHIVGPCFLLSTQQVVVLPTTPWIIIHMQLPFYNSERAEHLHLAAFDSGGRGALLPTEGTKTEAPLVQLLASASALASFCPVAPTGSICGNGVLEHDEDCDAGPLNSNGPDGPCRKGCRARRCGDGILDPSFGELCDAGPANSDQKDAPCRLDCRPKRCGDGILDSGERCDKGGLNSNSNPRVCRSDCTLCGDGVLDASHEKCDDGLEAGLCVQSGCSCPASCPSPLLRKMVSQRCDCFCPAGQVRDGDECREASAPPTNPSTDGCSPGLPCLGDVLLVIAPTSTNGGDSSSASEGGKNTTITVFEKTTNTPVLVAELKHVTKSVLVEIKSVKPEQHTPQLPSNLRVISQAVELDVVIGAVKAEEEGNSTASSSSSSSSSSGSSSEEESQQVVVLTFSLGPTHQFPGLLSGNQTAFLGSAPAPPSSSTSSSSSSSGGSESETKWKKASKPMTLTIKNDVLFASDQVTKTNGEGSTRYIVLMSAQEEEDGGSGGSLFIIIGASVGGAVLVAIVVTVAGTLYCAIRRSRFKSLLESRLSLKQLSMPGNP